MKKGTISPRYKFFLQFLAPIKVFQQSKIYQNNKHFFYVLLFYSVLLLNYNNKSLYLLFGLFYFFLRKKFSSSNSALLILLYFIGLPIGVGKAYSIEIIPAFLLAKSEFPNGFLNTIIFTPSFMVGITATIALVGHLILHKQLKELAKKNILLVALYILIIISSLLSVRPTISLYYASYILFPIAVFFLHQLQPYETQKKITSALVHSFRAIALIISVVAFAQFVLQKSIGLSIELARGGATFFPGPEERYIIYRPNGLFGHANELAMFLTANILMIFPNLYRLRVVAYQSVSYILSICLLTIVLLFTYSRSAWMGLVIALLYTAYCIEKIRGIHTHKSIVNLVAKLVFLLLPVGSIVFIPRLTDTIKTLNLDGSGFVRLSLIKQATDFILSNPITGSGSGLLVLEMLKLNPWSVLTYFPYPVHLVYLQLAGEGGIIAGFIFMVFLLRTLKLALTKKQNISYTQLGGLSSCIGLFFIGFFQPMFSIFLPLIFLSIIMIRYEHHKSLEATP